jgi:hypothetical protein
MRKHRHTNTYVELAKFLIQNGYTVTEELVEVSHYNRKGKYVKNVNLSYTFYRVEGKGITGGFCTPNKESYRYISGRIAADNENCFDKWSKCPVVIKISRGRFNEILKWLEYLSTDEGYEKSNNYEFFIYEME